MKRIVNGVTYNTETSTVLARISYESDDDIQWDETLYQTRGGAFFVDEQSTRKIWNERDQRREIKVTNNFVPKSAEEAHKWIMQEDNVEILRNPFDDRPEATAETEPGATIYVRVPASLKRSVEEAAKDNSVSGNVWAMRCIEQCLDKTMPQELIDIWHISAGLGASWESDDALEEDANLARWKTAKATKALVEIATLITTYALKRYDTDDFAKLGGEICPEWISRHFQPYPDDGSNSEHDVLSVDDGSPSLGDGKLSVPTAPKPPKKRTGYPESAKITVLVANNPKRPGSAAYDRFAFYESGMTVNQALNAGVRSDDLRWDVAHKFIKIDPTA
jgi:predicted HicB family RNase H-like nuclease